LVRTALDYLPDAESLYQTTLAVKERSRGKRNIGDFLLFTASWSESATQTVLVQETIQCLLGSL
jgi:hypothetical protein